MSAAEQRARGLKEFGEPTRKALIMDLAPEDREAAMFGLYYLLRDVVVSAAAFGFGVLGTVWFAIKGRDLGGTRQLSARIAP